MIINPINEPVHEAEFELIAGLSDKILGQLQDELVINAAMAVGLSLARLLDPTDGVKPTRSPEKDTQFVTDLMDWAMTYLEAYDQPIN